jgi:hypothetical protein
MSSYTTSCLQSQLNAIKTSTVSAKTFDSFKTKCKSKGPSTKSQTKNKTKTNKNQANKNKNKTKTIEKFYNLNSIDWYRQETWIFVLISLVLLIFIIAYIIKMRSRKY